MARRRRSAAPATATVTCLSGEIHRGKLGNGSAGKVVVPGPAWPRPRRLGVTLALALVAFLCQLPAGEARAANGPWQVSAFPLAAGAGDQVSPSVDGSRVAFVDGGAAAGERLLVRDALDPAFQQLVYLGEVAAGPEIDGGAVAWQDAEGGVCHWLPGTGLDKCITTGPAARLAFSGVVALTGEEDGGSVIRRVHFVSGLTRKLDSHALTAMRYDPDIEGDTAVWVRMRGYGSSYYEPLLVSYDIADNSWRYLTAVGGGKADDGSSVYQRRRPVIDGDRVFYQQRRNQPGSDWDIYEAVPDTYGVPLVERPGDQVAATADGRFLVYQDDRGGDWDLYLYDLEAGIEQPLCTAPGNQVSPSVSSSGVVAWQDDRGGDWDVYAAVLSPPADAGALPRLTLSLESVCWDDFASYLARTLTVGYRVDDIGAGPAAAAQVESVVTGPAAVLFLDDLPLPLGDIGPGESASFDLHFQVPAGVARFQTRLAATCAAPGGGRASFPEHPPA